MLTESKLKNWTVKYGREERVQHLMNQYRTFVSKNKIFQEFHKAYVEFKEVSDEYKRDGHIEPGESDQIDRFIREVSERWKNTSTELRCVQSLLEEVLTYWKRWNGTYEPLQKYIVDAFEAIKNDGEEAQYEYFRDLAEWREKYHLLQDTVAFLVATSDAAVGQDLRDRFDVLSGNWEHLFQLAEKFMLVGDVKRTKRDYQEGLERLDQWLRKAEGTVSTPQKVLPEPIKESLDTLITLHGEVAGVEEVFKSISRNFQQLVQHEGLSKDEVEDMMSVLKKEKENLVIIRSLIPTRLQLFHHLLSQLEAFEQGERDVLQWCEEAEELALPSGPKDQMAEELEQRRPFLSKTVNMQATVQSKNNIFQVKSPSEMNLTAIFNDLFQRHLGHPQERRRQRGY